MMVFLTWATWCNRKTAKQRKSITNWAFAHRNYKQLVKYYEDVTYEQHLWALIQFQNPYKLYDPDLFSAFHMLKHGPIPYGTSDGGEINCPYTPKSV
jgi:hypothetical protein